MCEVCEAALVNVWLGLPHKARSHDDASGRRVSVEEQVVYPGE